MRHIRALALLLPAAAQPAILVVAKTGPFTAIQSAVNSARTGDAILIHAGTYRESIVVTGDLTIRGAANEDSRHHRSRPDPACQVGEAARRARLSAYAGDLPWPHAS